MSTLLSRGVQPAQATDLYIVLEAGTLTVGTCEHCVVREHGRPDRAWNPDGDTDLDFNRDELIARLAALGVQVAITQEYVCP